VLTVHAVAFGPNDELVINYAIDTGHERQMLIELGPGQSLDAETGHLLPTYIGGYSFSDVQMTVTPQQQVVICEGYDRGSIGVNDFLNVITRFDLNGQVDRGYGRFGVVYESGQRVAFGADGSVVVARHNPQGDFALQKLAGGAGRELTDCQISFNNRRITVTGTSAGDLVDVALRDATQRLVVRAGTQTQSFPLAKVHSITMTTGAGADDISVADDVTIPTNIDAGAGSDTVQGGGGNDTIRGGPGDDSLAGNAGNNVLFGQGGDDQLTGGPASDTLIGGLGTDALNGGGGDDLIKA
jgi:Ca2+-binding RTX toxin-like protein